MLISKRFIFMQTHEMLMNQFRKLLPYVSLQVVTHTLIEN